MKSSPDFRLRGSHLIVIGLSVLMWAGIIAGVRHLWAS